MLNRAVVLLYLWWTLFLGYSYFYDPPKTPLRGFSPQNHGLKPINSEVLIQTWGGQLWTFWGQWEPSQINYWGGYRINKTYPCAVPCKYSASKVDFPAADLVVFDPVRQHTAQGRDDEWPSEPKPTFQRWAMLTYENYEYFPVQRSPTFLTQMDWVIDYEADADVRVTLMCDFGFGENGFLVPPPARRSQEQYQADVKAGRHTWDAEDESPPALAVFIASNCEAGGAKERTAYVQQLMQHIPVDSYGLCLNNRQTAIRNTHPLRFQEKIRILRKYKFVLAFENNNQTDYVTEKLPQALLAGAVPVYMGAPNIDEWLPGPHSVIKTADFGSPKELAEYLRRLDNDDAEYQGYFAWKRAGLSRSFKRLLKMCVLDSDCRVCEAVAAARAADHARLRRRRMLDLFVYFNAIGCLATTGLLAVRRMPLPLSLRRVAAAALGWRGRALRKKHDAPAV